MTLLAQDREGMQTLLDAIQEFEKWSGIPVNVMKTKQMTVDDIEDNREIIEELQPGLTYSNPVNLKPITTAEFKF